MTDTVDVSLRVNGTPTDGRVPARLTLADYLRDTLGHTGTKLGCEQGVCGACTVLVDGLSVRSCLMLTAQAHETDIRTVEDLAEPDGALHQLQQAFADRDALQCGFCTPGMLMASTELLREPDLHEEHVREALSGNLCRCTGYEGIVDAVLDVHRRCPVQREATDRGIVPGMLDVLRPASTSASTSASGSASASATDGEPASTAQPVVHRLQPRTRAAITGALLGTVSAIAWTLTRDIRRRVRGDERPSTRQTPTPRSGSNA